MLIPIGHENMTARRWPIITGVLIVINILAFLFTFSAMNRESRELSRLSNRILGLAAIDAEIDIPQEVQPIIKNFRENHPDEWAQLTKITAEQLNGRHVPLQDERVINDIQSRMNEAAQNYTKASQASLTHQYAFIPAKPHLLAYLTANFLHGGWLHLIGNMWFFWLAGIVLEDVWGRPLYLAFYLIAGCAALQFYAWTNTASLIPTVGASGAVAALMGAFLVRFPTMKIEMMWLVFFRRIRFHASAYWLLSLWLLVEVLYGLVFGNTTGVAHWAHVGGFLFGMAFAFGVKHSSIERKVDVVVENHLYKNVDPEIRRAYKYQDQQKPDEVLKILKRYVQSKPSSIEAWSLMRDIYLQKNEMPAYREAVLQCCALHLKLHEYNAVWRDYEDFANSGGTDLPVPIRFELCRLLDNEDKSERAVEEYEKLAREHPAEEKSLLALLAAGKIYLKKLNRPHDALRLYKAAAASPVPHLDYEQIIHTAMTEAEASLAFIGATVAVPRSANVASLP